MLPLARSLLALALAALLVASGTHAMCSLDGKGETFGGKLLVLPFVTVTESGDFEIPNNCKSRNMVLQGEVAMLCDWFRHSHVMIMDGGATVRVMREEPPAEPGATLFVRQYCKVKA